jgi:hypothetical protein
MDVTRSPTLRARVQVAGASTARALGHAASAFFHATVLGPTRIRCLILGHDDRFHREAGRLSLRCDECGRGTAGWTIGPTAPMVVPRQSGLSGSIVATTREAFGPTRSPFRLMTPTRFT